jgi:hypothetical protein
MVRLKYLRRAGTNQNSILKKIKIRLNLYIVCYYTVQNLSLPCLASRNVKIKISKLKRFVFHGSEKT